MFVCRYSREHDSIKHKRENFFLKKSMRKIKTKHYLSLFLSLSRIIPVFCLLLEKNKQRVFFFVFRCRMFSPVFKIKQTKKIRIMRKCLPEHLGGCDFLTFCCLFHPPSFVLFVYLLPFVGFSF